jgi:hypothetical protein
MSTLIFKEMLRVVVTGDRNWTDRERVRRVFDLIQGPVQLIHGDCQGLDKIAGQIGQEKGWNVIAMPAEWSKHGKAAGPIRNRQMLDLQPQCVIWFHDNLAESRGTADMIRATQERGIPCYSGVG